MQRVLVIGGTGLVGSHLVQLLADDGRYEVTRLVRPHTQCADTSPRIRNRVFDFDDFQDYKELSQESFDVVFCCLGTTRKKAGSSGAFRRVDFEYPASILNAVKAKRPIFCLVSSVGADVPSGLYLKTKNDIEKEIFSTGLKFVIARPSLLLGERKEFRLMERILVESFGRLGRFFREHTGPRVAKYAPVHAADVARALLKGAEACTAGGDSIILEGRRLFEMAS